MGKSAGKWNTSSVIYGGEKECVKYFDGEICREMEHFQCYIRRREGMRKIF